MQILSSLRTGITLPPTPLETITDDGFGNRLSRYSGRSWSGAFDFEFKRESRAHEQGEVVRYYYSGQRRIGIEQALREITGFKGPIIPHDTDDVEEHIERMGLAFSLSQIRKLVETNGAARILGFDEYCPHFSFFLRLEYTNPYRQIYPSLKKPFCICILAIHRHDEGLINGPLSRWNFSTCGVLTITDSIEAEARLSAGSNLEAWYTADTSNMLVRR